MLLTPCHGLCGSAAKFSMGMRIATALADPVSLAIMRPAGQVSPVAGRRHDNCQMRTSSFQRRQETGLPSHDGHGGAFAALSSSAIETEMNSHHTLNAQIQTVMRQSQVQSRETGKIPNAVKDAKMRQECVVDFLDAVKDEEYAMQ
eukprot:2920658-Amphidinium_carterae.1